MKYNKTNKIRPEKYWHTKCSYKPKKKSNTYKKRRLSNAELLFEYGDEALLESFSFGVTGQWGIARENNFGKI